MLIDDRAGSRDLVKYEPVKSTGELVRLDSADVCMTGNGPDGAVLIGAEVKTMWDLMASINTGRLQATQIPAMLKTYDVVWMLSYGKYIAGRDGALKILRGSRWRPMQLGKRLVPYGYLESFMIGLAAIGIHWKHTQSIQEAAQWLGVLERWWAKPWSAHKGMRTFDNSREMTLIPGGDSDMLQRARVAAQLPGVGFERALAAARYFGSVTEMVNAGAAEWVKVEGIGKVVAKAVERAVR